MTYQSFKRLLLGAALVVGTLGVGALWAEPTHAQASNTAAVSGFSHVCVDLTGLYVHGFAIIVR